jgi:glyoxylase-like metal-dependent hydrolase (beta-lactamase superfamily II)
MQEISPNIYIETAYPGVTLAALNCKRGLMLLDAPLRFEDSRSWRASLNPFGGGGERLLLTMDEHFDRTIGTRQMEYMTAGQEALTHVLRDRPVSYKAQGQETGAEWERLGGLGVVRWALPDITFSKEVDFYWDTFPVRLFSVAGPSHASIWVELPQQRVLFVGDTVVPDAPPFLAAANLTAWQEAVATLLSPAYKGYVVVSGRGGVVTIDEIKKQSKFLGKVQQQIEKLKGGADASDIEHASLRLVKSFDPKSPLQPQYFSRLVYGLTEYLRTGAA